MCLQLLCATFHWFGAIRKDFLFIKSRFALNLLKDSHFMIIYK